MLCVIKVNGVKLTFVVFLLLSTHNMQITTCHCCRSLIVLWCWLQVLLLAMHSFLYKITLPFKRTVPLIKQAPCISHFHFVLGMLSLICTLRNGCLTKQNVWSINLPPWRTWRLWVCEHYIGHCIAEYIPIFVIILSDVNYNRSFTISINCSTPLLSAIVNNVLSALLF